MYDWRVLLLFENLTKAIQLNTKSTVLAYRTNSKINNLLFQNMKTLRCHGGEKKPDIYPCEDFPMNQDQSEQEPGSYQNFLMNCIVTN